MKISYDTATDSISASGLDDEQNAALQRELSTALYRNDPMQTVAATIMAAARRFSAES